MIVGAGNMEGQMDVSNMIKPELARGRMKVIGATTLGEYQKYIEKDAALERRFQHVYLAEPNCDDTITILRGIKDKYEVHHGLRIKDSALIAAATLSNRYISDRFLPDKAVDLMDEAAAKLRMEMNSSPEEIDTSRRKLLQLEVEREALKKEKDSMSKDRLNVVKSEINQINKKLEKDLAVWEKEKLNIQEFQGLKEQLEKTKNNLDIAQRNQDYQGAAKIQYSDIPELEKKMETMSANIKNNHFIKLEVDPDDIAEIVSKWTGIPVTKLISGEKEKLLNLESKLRNRVKGQEEALKLTSDVIRMSKMGVSDEHRPIGSFLFMGNTGVGKTELAKSLAESLFDDERALVRIDMSEFMEPHSIAKLIGSPPGYVGYDEGGQLTEKIRRRPYSVILFDEIEKSHPNVLNILLQILDDGRLTDTKGRTVNFTNTIIIMTSNLKESELKSVLRPELLNRIDEIIIFDDLSEHIIEQIVEMQLEELRRKIALQKISIECDNSVKAYLVQNGYQREYGARPINRLIKREILSKLSRHMLENPETEKINITIDDGEIKLTEK